jgi:hypothetical protein
MTKFGKGRTQDCPEAVRIEAGITIMKDDQRPFYGWGSVFSARQPRRL